MSVVDIAPAPELRADEISAETIKRLASWHTEWEEKITRETILDGVASGALEFQRIHRCNRRVVDRTSGAAVWTCAEWEDVVVVRSKFGPLGGDRAPAGPWNAWCVKYGMPERRVLSKAERPEKKQNAPGLPAGPEKGTETAQLSIGISDHKPRRAARARSATRA